MPAPRPSALATLLASRMPLRAIARWIVRRHFWKPSQERWVKLPCNPAGGMAAVNRPDTWTDFDTAWRVYEAGGYDGIGFVFTSADNIVGGDFDHCVDPASGALSACATDALPRALTAGRACLARPLSRHKTF